MESEVAGYPQLASFMGSQPQNLIFRRFRTLNTKLLLYRQAQLTYLEKELKEAEEKDASSPHPKRKLYARDWRELEFYKSDDENDEGTRQLDLIREIEPLVKDYSE